MPYTEAIKSDEIAAALGIPTRLVELWKRGEKEMLLDPVQMLKLCTVLNCTLKELADIYSSWAK